MLTAFKKFNIHIVSSAEAQPLAAVAFTVPSLNHQQVTSCEGLQTQLEHWQPMMHILPPMPKLMQHAMDR
jgi:hypothetical protein